MPIPSNIDDREFQKFTEDSAGDTAVRTVAEGNFAPSGLRNGFLVTTLDVSTSAIKIPASPLTDRNSIIIFNKSTTTTLYLGPNNLVEANDNIGNNAGWEIPPNSYFSTDVTDGIEFYGIVASGTVRVKVLEVS